MPPLDLGSMFLLGLLGSGHCVGMCGPLVLAIPARAGGAGAHLLYHLGRVTTYVVVGAGLGALGGAAPRVQAAQVAASLVAASLLAVLGLARLGVVREPRWMAIAAPSRLPGAATVTRRAVEGGSARYLLAFGLLTGLLPCGLSWAAYARVLPSGGPAPAALMVLAFGLGTVPGLLLLGTAGSALARRWRRVFDLAAGVLMVAMATSLAADALVALG